MTVHNAPYFMLQEGLFKGGKFAWGANAGGMNLLSPSSHPIHIQTAMLTSHLRPKNDTIG